MDSKEAYKQWMSQFKINMMVYTNEQMFDIGYNYRNEYINELEDLVKELAKTALKKEGVKNAKARS